MLFAGLVLALAVSVPVSAHIALWDESMFGWDPNDPNQSEPVLPLMDLSFNDWWFHGYINKPPAAGKFMTLPAGGTYHGQVACNKALTKYGQNGYQQNGIYACDGDGPTGGIGAMHTADQWGSPDPKDVKGCGLSIAYESDEHKVQPEDFTVISTNWTCPWFKNVEFQIPADLPACPPEGCLCSWGWVHAIDAGSQQNYHLIYRCKVDGATGITAVPPAKTANKCDLPNDISNCTVGAKQPHYWYQKERNNNPQGQYDPPFYNGAYGFLNGAQTDLFATVGGAKVGAPAVSSAPVTSSSVSIPPIPVASASAPSSVRAHFADASSSSSHSSVIASSAFATASSLASLPAPAVSAKPSMAGPSVIPDKASSALNYSTSPLSHASPSSSAQAQVSASSSSIQAAIPKLSPSSASTALLSTTTSKSSGKICHRRRAVKREPLTAQMVGRPHERKVARSGKNASPHVIAQRRWEQDRAQRGLTKRSLGAGLF